MKQTALKIVVRSGRGQWDSAACRPAGRGGEAVKHRYNVLTWDAEAQQFTRHAGIRCRNLTIWGVRRALRALRKLGYSADRRRVCVVPDLVDPEYDWDSDPSVMVERAGEGEK